MLSKQVPSWIRHHVFRFKYTTTKHGTKKCYPGVLTLTAWKLNFGYLDNKFLNWINIGCQSLVTIEHKVRPSSKLWFTNIFSYLVNLSSFCPSSWKSKLKQKQKRPQNLRLYILTIFVERVIIGGIPWWRLSKWKLLNCIILQSSF